ncbi:hypothetical protein GCM10010206_01040 [Streptomyces cinerochromogenes]|nr:hypothetical protein GCM10010206_01040 [Streptomyces cinerochromogenes]
MVAAWAGAAVSAMPAVAAATAAAVRAFFGEAMRRMKETDTENLLRRGQGIARREGPRAVAVCVGPRPGWARGAWRRPQDKQARKPSAMTPFTSCGRIGGKHLLCDPRRNPQVRRGAWMDVSGKEDYGPAS